MSKTMISSEIANHIVPAEVTEFTDFETRFHEIRSAETDAKRAVQKAIRDNTDNMGDIVALMAFAHGLITKMELFSALTAYHSIVKQDPDSPDMSNKHYRCIQICTFFLLSKKKVEPGEILEYIFSTENTINVKIWKSNSHVRLPNITSTFASALIGGLTGACSPSELVECWDTVIHSKAFNKPGLIGHECRSEICYKIIEVRFEAITLEEMTQIIDRFLSPAQFREAFDVSKADEIRDMSRSEIEVDRRYVLYRTLRDAGATEDPGPILTEIRKTNRQIADDLGIFWYGIRSRPDVEAKFSKWYARNRRRHAA